MRLLLVQSEAWQPNPHLSGFGSLFEGSEINNLICSSEMSPKYETRTIFYEVKMSVNTKPQSEIEPKHESDSIQPGGFLAGLLIGGLTGAGAMLLLAPHSGKRTRADIQYKTTELRDQATDTVEDAVDQVRTKARQIKSSVRKEAKGLKRHGQEMVDDQMERVTDAVEAGKTAIKGT